MKNSQVIVRRLDDVAAVPCPCGESTRLLTRRDGTPLGLHVTRITDGDCHYHMHTDEVYYITEGQGHLEAGEDTIALSPGTVVYIPAGVRHRGEGDFTAVIITLPAFDPEDEFIIAPEDG